MYPPCGLSGRKLIHALFWYQLFCILIQSPHVSKKKAASYSLFLPGPLLRRAGSETSERSGEIAAPMLICAGAAKPGWCLWPPAFGVSGRGAAGEWGGVSPPPASDPFSRHQTLLRWCPFFGRQRNAAPPNQRSLCPWLYAARQRGCLYAAEGGRRAVARVLLGVQGEAENGAFRVSGEA